MKTNFTLFLTAIFLGAIWWGWDWPYIAKLMPIYVAAVPGLILVLVQLGREATGWENRRENQARGIEMDETHNVSIDRKSESRRTLTFFAWFIGGAVGIWLLGIVIALPLLVFLYMLVEGREKLAPAFVMTACTYGVIWGLFEYTLEMRWPAGQLFGY
jgi:Tripartite tricarboxylate transporter TctB family